MAIGTVLVRPQRFRRAAGVGDDPALFEDVATLAVRLAADPARAAPILALVRPALDAVSQRFQDKIAGAFAAAQQRLRLLLQGLVDFLRSLGKETLAVDLSVTEGLQPGRTVLEKTTEALGQLRPERIRAHAAALLDVVEKDL